MAYNKQLWYQKSANNYRLCAELLDACNVAVRSIYPRKVAGVVIPKYIRYATNNEAAFSILDQQHLFIILGLAQVSPYN